jgi:HSP20 family protein
MAVREPGPQFLMEALELLQEADRMHRQFFTVALGYSGPCWEPPVDMVEDAGTLVIRVALPGVSRDAIQVSTDGASLHVVGVRPLPGVQGEAIHRIEIPHGRFERRIKLPQGRYDLVGNVVVDGCLVLTLRRFA